MIFKAIGGGVVTALFVMALGRADVRQTPAAAIDIESLGPQVGETVPDFTLPDQPSTARSLKSLMGPKGALLVFFRSADW